MRNVSMAGLLIALCVLAACSATATPTPLPPTPTPTPSASIQASSIDEVVGVWLIHLAGGGEGDPAHFTLAADGTYAIDAVGGYHKGMHIEDGAFWFEDGAMKLETDLCQKSTAEFFRCVATYQAFVAVGGGRPVLLRMVAIDDPGTTDRRNSLNKKTFELATS